MTTGNCHTFGALRASLPRPVHRGSHHFCWPSCPQLCGVGVRREALAFLRGSPNQGHVGQRKGHLPSRVPVRRAASPGREGEGVASAPSRPGGDPGDALLSGKLLPVSLRQTRVYHGCCWPQRPHVHPLNCPSLRHLQSLSLLEEGPAGARGAHTALSWPAPGSAGRGCGPGVPRGTPGGGRHLPVPSQAVHHPPAGRAARPYAAPAGLRPGPPVLHRGQPWPR